MASEEQSESNSELGQPPTPSEDELPEMPTASFFEKYFEEVENRVQQSFQRQYEKWQQIDEIEDLDSKHEAFTVGKDRGFYKGLDMAADKLVRHLSEAFNEVENESDTHNLVLVRREDAEERLEEVSKWVTKSHKEGIKIGREEEHKRILNKIEEKKDRWVNIVDNKWEENAVTSLLGELKEELRGETTE